MLHFCKFMATEQEAEYLPETTKARPGGLVLSDVVSFIESGKEDFPTMVCMGSGDSYLINTPIIDFCKVMEGFYNVV